MEVLEVIEYLHNIDINLFLLINGWNSRSADFFFLVITQLGSGWVLAPLLTIIVLVKIRHKKIKNILLAGIIGMIASGIINNQIKIISGKQRPVKYFEKLKGKVAGRDDNIPITKVKVHTAGPIYNNKSFPSGHTCSAFAAATFLALLFKGWWYLTFIAALLVAYSRIYLGQHFPSDVVGGAILGIFIMATVIKIFGDHIKIVSDSEE
ncbi:MAG: phosphatase PAP2 family protein [Chitinispirillaceae bacterium]|nr:phosphatase PAP2 family protein [Chitinispirillaceae bacterium]